jgi:hypothetical protein
MANCLETCSPPIICVLACGPTTASTSRELNRALLVAASLLNRSKVPLPLSDIDASSAHLPVKVLVYTGLTDRQKLHTDSSAQQRQAVRLHIVYIRSIVKWSHVSLAKVRRPLTQQLRWAHGQIRHPTWEKCKIPYFCFEIRSDPRPA